MKITVISGTNRVGANSLKVANHIEDMYKAEGVEANVLNLQDLPKEIFDPTIYSQKPKPQSFQPFQDAITNTAIAGVAGLGCAWELFKIGAGVFFFLWVMQGCFG